jgi:hypothetical protein
MLNRGQLYDDFGLGRSDSLGSILIVFAPTYPGRRKHMEATGDEEMRILDSAQERQNGLMSERGGHHSCVRLAKMVSGNVPDESHL